MVIMTTTMLSVHQRITYKLADLTYKVRSTSTPVYLHRTPITTPITERACSRTLRSATIPLLDKPFMRTDFSKRAFRFSAPTVWNSLPQTVGLVLISDCLTVFKSRLKTFLFNQAFTEHWCDLPPVPLKLRPYGAIEIQLLLLLCLLLHFIVIYCVCRKTYNDDLISQWHHTQVKSSRVWLTNTIQNTIHSLVNSHIFMSRG